MKIIKDLSLPERFGRSDVYVWLLNLENSGDDIKAMRERTLRGLLAITTGQKEKEIVLAKTPHGKRVAEGTEFDWSVSYSSRYLAFAISFVSKIGIDIEETTRAYPFDDIAEKFFTPEERANSRTPEDFFAIWTAKEALVKALGLGFSFEPDRFSLGLSKGNIVVDKIEGYEKEDFSFETAVEGDVCLCVCSIEPTTTVRPELVEG